MVPISSSRQVGALIWERYRYSGHRGNNKKKKQTKSRNTTQYVNVSNDKTSHTYFAN